MHNIHILVFFEHDTAYTLYMLYGVRKNGTIQITYYRSSVKHTRIDIFLKI